MALPSTILKPCRCLLYFISLIKVQSNFYFTTSDELKLKQKQKGSNEGMKIDKVLIRNEKRQSKAAESSANVTVGSIIGTKYVRIINTNYYLNKY